MVASETSIMVRRRSSSSSSSKRQERVSRRSLSKRLSFAAAAKEERVRQPKSVRFRRASKDPAHVSCMIQEYEKEMDPKVLDSLFWTSEELKQSDNNSREDDDHHLDHVQSQYCDALRSAYHQSSSAMSSDDSIDVDFQEECSQVRGLEHAILPSVHRYTKKHRRAVLLFQQVAEQKGLALGGKGSNNCDEKLRKASLKYSRPSRLVAIKIAQLDTNDNIASSDSSSSPTVCQGATKQNKFLNIMLESDATNFKHPVILYRTA